MLALSIQTPKIAAPRSLGRDAAFIAMLDAYRPSGGLARADELIVRWRDRHPGTAWQLARWIGQDGALHFRWAHDHWLPLFQFQQASTPLLLEGIKPVMDELRPVLDAWELSHWFATPNAWLNERCPADLMTTQWEQVHEAARADRFVLSG